jgi:formylglycine-generating enzyme required for sulfatase activity
MTPSAPWPSFAAVRFPARGFARLLGALGALAVTIAGAEPAAATGPEPTASRAIPDLALTLLWVKPGEFTMGSPPDEPNRNKAEGRPRRVTLTTGFWLGKTEVTQSQYEAVDGANPSRFTDAGKDAPVERVSWLDAMAWCKKLTARERGAGRLPKGYAYTLPTEAQWEYACRAGTIGDYAGNPDAMAWHDRNSGETTHLVGRKEPNAWGFHDMSGNVLEWCLDWYGDYPRGAETDPAGPDSGYFRMARGGSWRMKIEVGRSAARAGGSPARRDYTLGFRLALTAVH